jgi:hypothetical protein
MKAPLGIAASTVLLAAAAPPITFTPVQPNFAAAADEYRQLWCDEGVRIVQALEEASGQPFPATPIEVFVANVTPMTAYDGRTIWLKASYPAYYKRATLVHELGHRLSFTMARSPDLDDHRLLYLFLHETWSQLYGTAFADRMAQAERRIRGRYDYAGAWDWALAMTSAQRRERLVPLRTTPPAAPPKASGERPAGCA